MTGGSLMPFCSNCANEVSEQAFACPRCGHLLRAGQTGHVATLVATSNGVATASMVLGIIGLVLSFIPFIGFVGIPCSVLGLVLGIVGVVKAGKLPDNKGKGQAIAGIILSTAAIAMVFIVAALFIEMIDACLRQDSTSC